MSDNLCDCHCGTRITIDQQLLQQRQIWRQKYNCLQKQASNDIGKLKENIYAECASLMQSQFSAREVEQTAVVNSKNSEINNLTGRVINLEAKIKILEKENEILRNKGRELDEEVAEQDVIIQSLRSRGSKSQRDWEIKLEQDITAVRKRITQQYQDEQAKLQTENQHLRHKVRQFQKKYQLIIPEVEKLKQALGAKGEQVETLEGKLDKLRRDNQQQVARIKQENEELEKVHSKCKGTISKLVQKVQSLTQDLQTARKVKKQVKIEPVYIQRPVQVQKIVERIVQVQKIVNKYIQPTTFRDQQLQSENIKLKQQINHLLRQLSVFQQKYKQISLQYDQFVHQHQDNVNKYKKERQSLVRSLQQQHKEIQSLHIFIERKKNQAQIRSEQPQKIVVHVNRDGTYQKTVQRLPSNSNNPTSSNPRPNRR